jgi:hypothetical protein
MLANVFRVTLSCCVTLCAATIATPAHADSPSTVTNEFSDVLADLGVAARLRSWYERRHGMDPLDADGHDSRDSTHLVVEEDGVGGADVLTVRYPIDADGIFRTFVGAGLGRAEYYEEGGAESAAIPLAFRETHHALGAVAEVGSEWHASDRLRVNASVRWADVAGDARAIRTEHGPVSAEPIVLALALGYRFR